MSLSSLDPSSIARESLTDPRSLDTQISQTRHRIEILKGWAHILSSSPDDANANEGDNELQAALGKCVLDIGCGQGDHLAATAALFKAQAEHAQGADKNVVIGVDPARLDYGTCAQGICLSVLGRPWLI
jgi:SAM-dependent methyltransferase